MARHKEGALHCPHCDSTWLRVNRGVNTCKQCGAVFRKEEVPPKSRKACKTHSGSGVIAGKITIGKGMKWGAGY